MSLSDQQNPTEACPLLAIVHHAGRQRMICNHPANRIRLPGRAQHEVTASICDRCTIKSWAVEVPKPTPAPAELVMVPTLAAAVEPRGPGDWLADFFARLGFKKCKKCKKCDWRRKLLNRVWRWLTRQPSPAAKTRTASTASGCGKPCGQSASKPAKAITAAPAVRVRAKNPLPDVTFAITSFERPWHLARLLASINQHYPSVRIVIADCSKAAPTVPAGVELIRLPVDAGLSAMRNALVAKLQTAFLLLLEEDFVFTADTKIAPLLQILHFDGAVGCVAGSMRIIGTPGIQDYAIDLESFRGVLHGHPASRPERFTPGGMAYQYADKVLNFALYRREMLEHFDWSGLPKVGEHAAYFWRVKEGAQWRAAHTPASIIDHDYTGRSEVYKAGRSRASKLQKEWFAAIGIPAGYHQDAGLSGPMVRVNRPNIILLGVGHSGTTIATKMLETLGWNLGDANEEFAESVSVHALNEPVPMREWRIAAGAGHPDWKLDIRAAESALRKIPQPWCIKDPRWIYALPPWMKLLAEYKPFLFWLRRDSAAVAASFVRRGELPTRGVDEPPQETIAIRLKAAQGIFDSWPPAWGKVAIDYESLAAAVRLFTLPA